MFHKTHDLCSCILCFQFTTAVPHNVTGIMLLTVQVKRVKKQKEKEKKLASWKIPSLILRILKQCFSVLDFLRKG